MISLFVKEINFFFSSLIGFIIIGMFILINGILLWSNISSVNILDYGYANMDMFFSISPILLLFFIPALSMRIFSEEYNTGTIELLLTKPLSYFQIIIGKFLSIFFIVILSIIPTFIYVFSIYYLQDDFSNIDLASIIGSYIGLMLLSSLFISISVFASSLSNNQVISLMIGIAFCSLFYFGFDLISSISIFSQIDLLCKKFGVSYHYFPMSKGLLRLTDIVYFISSSFVFIKLTELSLENRIR